MFARTPQWNRHLIRFALLGVFIIVLAVAYQALNLNSTASEPELTATEAVQGYPVGEVALMPVATQLPQGYPISTPRPVPPRTRTSKEIALTVTAASRKPVEKLPTPHITLVVIPTPIVTRIPVAQLPFIPIKPGHPPAKPYRILFRNEMAFHAFDSQGLEEHVVFDLKAKPQLVWPKSLNSGLIWRHPSPDGTRLALVLNNAENLASLLPEQVPTYNIHLFDLVTGEEQLFIEDGLEPVWSPDGAKIAYRDTKTAELKIREIATSQTWIVYQGDHIQRRYPTDINWSPDSQQIVFIDETPHQYQAIMRADATGLAPAQVLVPWESYYMRGPKWSSDGSRILFISDAGQTSSAEYFYNLWVMNSDGTDRRQITQDMQLSDIPSWSPDGQRITFSGRKGYEELLHYSLWLINPSGGDLKRLASDTDDISSPQWLPDGLQIIFVKDQQERKEVWTLQLDDGAQRKLPGVTSDFIVLQ